MITKVILKGSTLGAFSIVRWLDDDPVCCSLSIEIGNKISAITGRCRQLRWLHPNLHGGWFAGHNQNGGRSLFALARPILHDSKTVNDFARVVVFAFSRLSVRLLATFLRNHPWLQFHLCIFLFQKYSEIMDKSFGNKLFQGRLGKTKVNIHGVLCLQKSKCFDLFAVQSGFIQYSAPHRFHDLRFCRTPDRCPEFPDGCFW